MTDFPLHSPRQPAKPLTPPLAVDAKSAAAMFGVSRSQWWKLHASGKVPTPTYALGAKAPRWDLANLLAWWNAGAPDRQTWQKMRGTRP